MPKHQPDGWPTVIPRMIVPDPKNLVAFMKSVFGATGDYRPGRPAEMRIRDSIIMVMTVTACAIWRPRFYTCTSRTPTRPTLARSLPVPHPSKRPPTCPMAIGAPW